MIETFLQSVIKTHASGHATEHSYRPALQQLFNALDPKVTALNEPKRVNVGAPDFSISRGDIVIGHCEAKDLHIDLKAMKDANLTQKKRYVGGLSNLLYTNCLEWVYYRDGEQVGETIRIADYLMGIRPLPARYPVLEQLLRTFIAQTPQTITSSRALAERMAGKAVLIKDILANSLSEDKDGSSELMDQYSAFKEHLIHDISINDFADIYAETITYGMFAARLHDTTLNTFNRAEALELLPKSNPFLRSLFGYIAGPNLDQRISWIIDDLAEVFRASDVSKLMETYGKTTQRNDPFLHFYEDFLKAYNPAKRDVRGVWYTPEPVVNFIVRAVDDVLKTEFGLADGLADTSKVTIDWDTGQRGVTKKGKLVKNTETVKETREVHRVQILDPATGTGTFLAEVIKQIAPRVKSKAPGMWASYVEKDLIPRLHGFELLMASYAMCHMKLDMVLREYGYQPTKNPPRVSVYLTNSLEEGEAANQTLPFAQWLSNEVREANKIKRDMPIMCVIGNPPYSGHSSNKGAWISALVDDYKKSEALRKPAQGKWLSDDYVKFIRLAEHLIAKTGSGVLGYITNHSYIDNPTFFEMRRHLLETFDRIYVFDLQGSAKKANAKTFDKNVFDIQQGVAILVCVKRKKTVGKKSSDLATLTHREIWAGRAEKYEVLWRDTVESQSSLVETTAPDYAFKPRDRAATQRYNQHLSLKQLFSPYGDPAPGAVSTHDQFAVSWTQSDARDKVHRLLRSSSEDEARQAFRLCSQEQWNYGRAKQALSAGHWEREFVNLDYRMFDRRHTVYNPHVFVHRRERLNSHLVGHNNLALVTCRQAVGDDWVHAFVARHMIDDCLLSNKTKERSYGFPLYLYPAPTELDQTRRVNFEPKLYAKLRELAAHPKRGEPNELAVFDYIYGVLHCPAYREAYAEFLKIDFPRVPWPASPDVFWDVADKGSELRRLHLMEAAAVGETPYPFAGGGGGAVVKPEYRDGAVWINKEQRFENAPEVSWGFYIGGYQPAQKWLKDRKGRALDYEDVKHYQRILKILAETDRIMKTIEMPLN